MTVPDLLKHTFYTIDHQFRDRTTVMKDENFAEPSLSAAASICAVSLRLEIQREELALPDAAPGSRRSANLLISSP